MALARHLRYDTTSTLPDHRHRTGAVPIPPKWRRSVKAVVVLAALGTLLSACTSGTTSATPSATKSVTAAHSTHPAASATITIKNFAFSPDTLTVQPRARVTVVNRDTVTHTLTSTTRVFNTGDIAPGQTVTFTAPAARGTYPYLCLIHQYMTGTLIVS